MQQASCLEGGPLLWIWPLYLHVNKKSDDNDDDDVKSTKVREKLINEGNALTLEKCMDIARTYELSQKQLKTMNSGEDPNAFYFKQKKS